MNDEEEFVQTTWREISEIARRHFVRFFGIDTPTSEEAMEEVFAAQTEQILERDCEALEKDITLEELHEATKQLAKNKVPSRDGIPVEFFLVLWDQIGPILLELLKDGLKSGILHPN